MAVTGHIENNGYFVIPNPDLEEQMNVEDEYLAELIKRDNKISFFQQLTKQKEQELTKEKARTELEKKKAEQEKVRANQEKERAEQEKGKAEKERQMADQNKVVILDLARMLKNSGVSIEMIQEKTKLNIKNIEKL